MSPAEPASPGSGLANAYTVVLVPCAPSEGIVPVPGRKAEFVLMRSVPPNDGHVLTMSWRTAGKQAHMMPTVTSTVDHTHTS